MPTNLSCEDTVGIAILEEAASTAILKEAESMIPRLSQSKLSRGLTWAVVRDSVTVGRVSTARLLGMCGNHG
jgi:hypothetical protein